MVAERVGFVPVVLSPINDLGLIRSPQFTKSTQNLGIRYETGTAESASNRGPVHKVDGYPPLVWHPVKRL